MGTKRLRNAGSAETGNGGMPIRSKSDLGSSMPGSRPPHSRNSEERAESLSRMST